MQITAGREPREWACVTGEGCSFCSLPRCELTFVRARPRVQETFDEALWPRHLEYRNSALAASDSKRKVHVLDAEQAPAKILDDALPIVDDWAVSVVTMRRHNSSKEKNSLIAREMDALNAGSTAAAKKSSMQTSAPRCTL